jgi:alkylation response protein AidB-like acyl-CoA dehydrogenase
LDDAFDYVQQREPLGRSIIGFQGVHSNFVEARQKSALPG